MKRRFLIMIFAAALSVGMISGCGEKKEAADTAQENTQEETSSSEEAESTPEAEVSPEAEDSAEEPSEGQTAVDIDQEEEAVDEAEAEAAGFSDGAQEDENGGVVLNTDELLSGIHHVEIEIQDHGTLSVELDANVAPITVTNFIKLVQEDFYDGLTFHRIMDGFMMQGGDPLGNGTGGAPETIKGEFADNGVDNDISHTRGTISMARSSAPDSASSQFFIVQTDSTFLDGSYAGFGHVTEGMEIVDEICKAAGTEDRTIPADEQPVITDIVVID